MAIFMSKVYCKMLPLTPLKLFTHYYPYYFTRQSFTFLNYSKACNRQHCVVYAGVRICNSLESGVRESKNQKLVLINSENNLLSQNK